MTKPNTLKYSPLWLRHDPPKDELERKRFSELPKSHKGEVYFLISELGVKIGCARNTKKRIQQIDGILPFETDLMHIITTSDMFGVEHAFHFYFSDKHIRGEWFDLNEEDIEMIKKLKGPPRTPKPPDHPYMTEDVPF
jgi:hypothetical protein